LYPYILFYKYINILTLEMASSGNRHCANCVGTLSFPILARIGANSTDCFTIFAVRLSNKYVTVRRFTVAVPLFENSAPF